MLDLDIHYMTLALAEAKKSFAYKEIPVGSIIVHKNKIIGRGFNQKEHLQIATKHAEIIAIEEACKHLGSWRLDDCILYVTLEPCIMCSGAIIQSHLGRIVVGAKAQKQKGFFSLVEQFQKPAFNHYPLVVSGVCEIESQTLLKDFFKSLRGEKYEKN